MFYSLITILFQKQFNLLKLLLFFQFSQFQSLLDFISFNSLDRRNYHRRKIDYNQKCKQRDLRIPHFESSAQVDIEVGEANQVIYHKHEYNIIENLNISFNFGNVRSCIYVVNDIKFSAEAYKLYLKHLFLIKSKGKHHIEISSKEENCSEIYSIRIRVLYLYLLVNFVVFLLVLFLFKILSIKSQECKCN